GWDEIAGFSVNQGSNRLRVHASPAWRSHQCNGSRLRYDPGALDAHRGGDDMRRLLAAARGAHRRNAMANGVLPRSDRSRPPGEILSFRGAVLSRRRSDPTGATPCCPGDYRRCLPATTFPAHPLAGPAPPVLDTDATP